jgi:sporulation protein YlmC with PRC-barrel domain
VPFSPKPYPNVSNTSGDEFNPMDILQLVDKEVIGLNGWIIGIVKNVEYDDKTWKVESLDVELDGDVAKEFEMKKILRSTHIPLDVSLIQGIGDKVTLKLGKEELMALIGRPS